MLPPLKHWLEKHNWYLKFRYHSFVVFIWLRLRRRVAKNLLAQKKIYQSLLENIHEKLVIDAGANEGFLTSIFCSLGFHVIAIEPSQRNFSILRTRFSKISKITLIKAALSDRNEQGLFFENKNDYAIGTLSEKWKNLGDQKYASEKSYSNTVKVQMITLDEVVKKFGTPGFIKIDVEGYEYKVLNGLTHAVPLISFEAILPEFMNETINCMEYLFSLSDDACFNYTTENRWAYNYFVSKNELIASLGSLPPQTIEIFCKS